jgi:hypothetical protein
MGKEISFLMKKNNVCTQLLMALPVEQLLKTEHA